MSNGYDFSGRLIVHGQQYRIVVENDVVKEIISEREYQQKMMAQQGVGAGDGDGRGQLPNAALLDMELDKVFKARLSSILTDNKYLRHLAKRKRGKLDTKGLWRVPTGATNVFTQKQARKGRHYNIALLVDQSGSMQGDRIRLAIEVAVFLGKHFEALDIDFSVIGFASEAKVQLKMGTKMDTKALFQQMQVGNLGGGTDMFEGLKLAVQELKGRPGQKLMVVVSDGETSNPKETRAVLHANTDIRAFGVGIGDDCRVIPEHQRVNNVDDLKPVILNWLGMAIRRGA